MENISRGFGWLGASGTTLSFLPQVYKMFRTKDVEGISPMMMVVHLTGVSSWIVYGILRKDSIVIASNSVAATLVLAILCRYTYLKKTVEPSTPTLS
jgi:MtN3 and saliva related transmembrane protein